jgi:hypothetical protein
MTTTGVEEAKKEMDARHNNAAALIVVAAKKSGLLNEVAEALCFINKTSNIFDCRECEIYERLAEAFDEHTGLTVGVLESFHGPGVGVGPFTADELAPYLVEGNPNA